jgi:hypothetical protein
MSTVSLKFYYDCLVYHTMRPRKARISFPTFQLFTSIARRSDTIFLRTVPISSWTLWCISSDFFSHVPPSLQSHSWTVFWCLLHLHYFSLTVPGLGYLTSTALRSAVGTSFHLTTGLCCAVLTSQRILLFSFPNVFFLRGALSCFMSRNAAYSAEATLASGLDVEGGLQAAMGDAN